MRRKVRALATDIHLDVNFPEKLSSISPLFTHRMINLPALFHVQTQNYVVRVFKTN